MITGECRIAAGRDEDENYNGGETSAKAHSTSFPNLAEVKHESTLTHAIRSGKLFLTLIGIMPLTNYQALLFFPALELLVFCDFCAENQVRKILYFVKGIIPTLMTFGLPIKGRTISDSASKSRMT